MVPGFVSELQKKDYPQVWATSNKVGCGYARCHMKYENKTKTFHNYVCNYCPM